MSIMYNKLAFAGGIRDLSPTEIGFVHGGFGDDLDEGFFEAQTFGDDWELGKKKKKKDNDQPVPAPTPEIPDSVTKKIVKKIPVIGTVVAVIDIARDIYDWLGS